MPKKSGDDNTTGDTPVTEPKAKDDKPKAKDDKPKAGAKVSPLDAVRSLVLKRTGQVAVTEKKGPIPAAPSGSVCIDDLIGGTLSADKSGPKCPGYPRRHITEIYGAESSGKTTAAIQAIAAVQAEGGSAMFIDFEQALDHQYARRVGMSFDQDKLALFQPENLEQGWEMIHVGIAGGVDLIVVDSVAAMVPSNEFLKKLGDAPKIGAVAASMAQNLPKVCVWLNSSKYDRNPKGTALVFLNQIRASISTGGGGGQGTSENTAGGYALKFFTYLRIKFTRIRTEKLPSKRKDAFTGKEVTIPYGNLTQVKLVKSKVDGKQGFTTEIFIRFNHGIDDFYSLIEAGVANKVISKTGAFYTYGGQKYQGRDKLRKHFIDNPKLFQELRTKVLKLVRDDALVEAAEPESEEDLMLFNGEETEEHVDSPDEIVIEDAAEEESTEGN